MCRGTFVGRTGGNAAAALCYRIAANPTWMSPVMRRIVAPVCPALPAVPAGNRIPRLRRRGPAPAATVVMALLLGAAALLLPLPFAAAAGQKYQSDDWVTECEGGASGECSIIVPFWKVENGQKGSFALAVMLQTGDIGIVGQPPPLRATLRIDNHPPLECREPRQCLFPHSQGLAAIGLLGSASVLLIDVVTQKTTFRFSLTARGYQAGLAQIRAWNFRFR
jgi:hypothetical protein